MSTNRLDILKRRQADALAEARSVVDAAESRGESTLSDTAQRRYSAAIADIDKFSVAIQEEEVQSRRAALAAASPFAAVAGDGRSARESASLRELRDFMTPGNATSQLWLTPPREQVMGHAGEVGKRATFLTTDTGTIGSAYYFTTELYKNVVLGLIDASGVLEADPTLIVTNHLRDIQVPALTADATASAGTEGSEATEANPTGDAVTLGAFRFDGRFKVSLETIMAAEYDLPNLLGTFATRSIANKVAEMLAVGAGTTEPLGVFTAAAVTVGNTAASATTVTADEMLAMTKALGKGYRKQAKLVTSDVLHTAMLGWKQGDGDYLMRSVDGGGYEFAGKPLYTEPQGDQTGMSASEVHAIFGDFSSYFVRTTPMFFQRSDADPLNPEFTFAIWLDANVADANGLVSLAMGS